MDSLSIHTLAAQARFRMSSRTSTGNLCMVCDKKRSNIFGILGWFVQVVLAKNIHMYGTMRLGYTPNSPPQLAEFSKITSVHQSSDECDKMIYRFLLAALIQSKVDDKDCQDEFIWTSETVDQTTIS